MRKKEILENYIKWVWEVNRKRKISMRTHNIDQVWWDMRAINKLDAHNNYTFEVRSTQKGTIISSFADSENGNQYFFIVSKIK